MVSPCFHPRFSKTFEENEGPQCFCFINTKFLIAQGTECDHMHNFLFQRKPSETVTERQIQMGSSVQREEYRNAIWGSSLKQLLQSQEKQAVIK